MEPRAVARECPKEGYPLSGGAVTPEHNRTKSTLHPCDPFVVDNNDLFFFQRLDGVVDILDAEYHDRVVGRFFDKRIHVFHIDARDRKSVV